MLVLPGTGRLHVLALMRSPARPLLFWCAEKRTWLSEPHTVLVSSNETKPIIMSGTYSTVPGTCTVLS